MRALITQSSAASADSSAEILLTTLEAIINEHCRRVGIFSPQLHEAGEESWLADGVQFEPEQWAIKIDKHRLLSRPGSELCALVGEQLHVAEFTAARIGQQAPLRAAAQAGKLLTNAQWRQAKQALTPLRIPVNRHLLQEVAEKSTLTMACGGDAPQALHALFEDAYLAPIAESLADNTRALAARLSVPAGQDILPGPEHTTLLAQSVGGAPLFFRADRHCEQISLFILLDRIDATNAATSSRLELVRMNLSRQWTPLGYFLEIQQSGPHSYALWLYRVRHIGMPDRQDYLMQEIKNDAAALRANRETYLHIFQTGCGVIKIR
jgi:hypothetical protein